MYKPIGVFDYYTCDRLEGMLKSSQTTEAEMQRMMRHAGDSTGGKTASNLAYRSEYARARAYQKHFAELIAKKNCRAESTWSSERALR